MDHMTNTKHGFVRGVVGSFAVLLAAYLVGRAGVELVTIHYDDAASYRADWGGPSLVGVLAVHAGPGLAVLTYCGLQIRSWLREGGRA